MKYFSLTGWCNLKLFLALGIFVIFCSISKADIPNLINFQGILDSAGNPLANKTKSVEFKIYAVPAGGTAYWSETQPVTTNAGGVFNVLLGFSNPIPDSVFDDTVRYLSINVGTDGEMSPRQQIVSNAYGYRVATVDGATGGVISGDVDIQSDLTVSGNVGIGTASPLSQLHLESSNPTSEGIRIYNTSASGDPNIHFLTDGVFQYTLGVDNDDGDKLQISAGSTLNSSELLTLTTAGNVGIGTTNPGAKLHVLNGNIQVGSQVASAGIEFYPATAGTPTNAGSISGVGGSTNIAIMPVGNVGIGTTSPRGALDVQYANYPGMYIGFPGGSHGVINTADGLYFTIDSDNNESGTTANFIVAHNNSGPNATELFRIQENGNVGIGTTSPQRQFVVAAATPIMGYKNTGDGLGWATYIDVDGHFKINEYADAGWIIGSNRVTFEKGGNVGIGTASPQGALDVSSTTGAFIVPRMTTAQRNLLTAVNGMIIYNTDAVAGGQFEFRENGAWVTK